MVNFSVLQHSLLFLPAGVGIGIPGCLFNVQGEVQQMEASMAAEKNHLIQAHVVELAAKISV